MFDCIESGKYQWEERTINLDDITLTGMSEDLTDIIYSDEVQQCPLKFVEYIRRHSDDDRFSEIQTTMVPQNRQTLLLREDNGTLKMLDGSHRLISMIMNGIKSTNAYVAVANSNGARPMIGDAIFLRLRKLWEQTADPLFRASIEKTVIGMIKATRNGEQSVDSYWVRMAPNEEVRAVGRRLVDESKPIVSD